MNSNAERFEKYVRDRKHHPPRLLYKYTSLATARRVIDGEAVRFASPLEFNDPLDTQWNMLWQLSTPAFNKALVLKMFAEDFDVARVRSDKQRAWIVEQRAKYASMTAAEKEQYLAAQIASLDRDIVMDQPLSDQLKRLRVFCLGSRPDSIQMWSYYADEHKGVVLAFDSAALEGHWKFPVDKVVYSVKLPEVLDPARYPSEYLDAFAYDQEIPPLDHDRAAYLWALSKDQGWRHEEEWRFVHIADRGDTSLEVLNSIPMNAVMGMALGCKGCRHDFDSLAGAYLSKNPNGNIWLTDRHSSEFALVATPIDTSRWVKR